MYKVILWLLLALTTVHSKPWLITYSQQFAPATPIFGPVNNPEYFINHELDSAIINAPVTYVSSAVSAPVAYTSLAAPIAYNSPVLHVPVAYTSVAYATPALYSLPYSHYLFKK